MNNNLYLKKKKSSTYSNPKAEMNKKKFFANNLNNKSTLLKYLESGFSAR